MLIDSYYLFASSIAALISRSITYPLDTIKTRLQTNQSHQYTLIPDGTQDPTHSQRTFTLSNFLQLYRGISITLLFSVPALTVYLTTYELSKSILNSYSLPILDSASLLNHAISGSFAELFAGVLFTPMEIIKSQLQIMSTTATLTSSHHNHSTISLAKAIARQEGPVGFYRGYWISIAVFLPYTVIYFIIYEQLKTIFPPAEQTFFIYLVCSAAASTCGIIASTPLDIIKTRWQVSLQESAYRGGPLQIAKHMYLHEGGWKAFTRGMMVRIAWGIPSTAINMTVFESLLKLHNESA